MSRANRPQLAHTYTDSSYHIAFQYPSSWKIERTERGMMGGIIDQKAIIFTKIQTQPDIVVSLYSYNNFNNDPLLNEGSRKGILRMRSQIQRLREIFQLRKTTDTDTLEDLLTDAVLIAHTPVQYIESSDGSFRGIYYFEHAEQQLTDISITMIRLREFVAVLTDGKGTIIQIDIDMPTTPSDWEHPSTVGHQIINDCRILRGSKSVCGLNTELLSNFEKIYKNIILSIKSI